MARLRTDPPAPPAGVEDLTGLLWSSIDNPDSMDLDQLEWAERLPDGSTRLLVAIADVDALVPAGSPVDARAGANTTSLYTGAAVFPMLPPALSEDLTSLLPKGERAAVVIGYRVLPDGSVADGTVRRARVLNRAKLSYPELGPWLGGKRADSRLGDGRARAGGAAPASRFGDPAAAQGPGGTGRAGPPDARAAAGDGRRPGGGPGGRARQPQPGAHRGPHGRGERGDGPVPRRRWAERPGAHRPDAEAVGPDRRAGAGPGDASSRRPRTGRRSPASSIASGPAIRSTSPTCRSRW